APAHLAPRILHSFPTRRSSDLKSGRSDLWQKIRADKTGDFVVVGYTAPKGSRGGFGALHLGGYADGRLVYAGRAGSGFTGQMLRSEERRVGKEGRARCAAERAQ